MPKLSVESRELPPHVALTLRKLFVAGYKDAKDHKVENRDMQSIGVTKADLREALRTAYVAFDSQKMEPRPPTGIVTAVGQDENHTYFRLLVDLIE